MRVRKLDVYMKPQPIDNKSLYWFCNAFYADDSFKAAGIHINKEHPIEFNCVDQTFNERNLVPNATIINDYNREMMKFAEAMDISNSNVDINDAFNEYLFMVNQHGNQLGSYSYDTYKDYHGQFMSSYEKYKEDYEKEYSNAPETHEYVFEYKTDEKAYETAMKHQEDNRTKGGLDFRAKQVLGTLKKGHELEVYIADQLMKRYGIDIGLYYGKEDQEHGECALGFEFKNDVMSKDTLNAYCEYGESRNGEKIVKSGFSKNDNTKYLVIGTKERFSVVSKDALQLLYDNYVKDAKNTMHMAFGGVCKEVPEYDQKTKRNFINQMYGINGRVEKTVGNGIQEASQAITIFLPKFEELADDIGIDGMARLAVKMGADHTKEPPEKEDLIKRDVVAYTRDKMIGAGSTPIYKTSEDRRKAFNKDKDAPKPFWKSRFVYDEIRDVSNSIEKQNSGVNMVYVDNAASYNRDGSLKAPVSYDALALASYTPNIKAPNGTVLIPMSSDDGKYTIADTKAQKIIVTDIAEHNSKEPDTTYILYAGTFKRYLDKHKDEREAFEENGVKYVAVPKTDLTYKIDGNTYAISQKTYETNHVNAYIDEKNNDIKELIRAVSEETKEREPIQEVAKSEFALDLPEDDKNSVDMMDTMPPLFDKNGNAIYYDGNGNPISNELPYKEAMEDKYDTAKTDFDDVVNELEEEKKKQDKKHDKGKDNDEKTM